jgi:nucleotide-binding universal stress UspA family protein
MKTILVPVGGSDTDTTVFETALAVARQVGGHLEFLHIRVGQADAALNTPHIEFARGAALALALNGLDQRSQLRAAAAERHVRQFCVLSDIDMVETPRAATAVTARWRLEEGDALSRLLFHARHNDLVVMGRPAEADGLPRDRLETLLIESGRPLLIAPARPRDSMLGTIAVCWKESAEAARALAAALPLIRKAERVVVVGAHEPGSALADALGDLVGQLGWHGIDAEPQIVSPDGRPIVEGLLSAAHNCGAGLMVMGGYGHRHLRQVLFGGCTQTVIEGAELPVLIAS